MRQINSFVQIVATLIFQKDSIRYEIEDETNLTDTDILHKKLLKLMDERKLCEAERLLYDSYQPDNLNYLEIAVDFYQRVNLMKEKELESCQYSREKIEEGLHKVLKESNIELPY